MLLKSALKMLASQLNLLGLSNEALYVYALVNRAEKRTKLFSDPSYQKNIQALLKELGLSPNYNIEDAVNLLSAAAYLKEGITDNNLFLAGLSIAALIPSLEDLKSVSQTTNIPVNSPLLLPIAQLIDKNQGLIKGSLDKFKDPKLKSYIEYYIPDGELLIQYSDRIWNALKAWSFKEINKPPTENEEENPSNEDDLNSRVDQMLSDFNDQL